MPAVGGHHEMYLFALHNLSSSTSIHKRYIFIHVRDEAMQGLGQIEVHATKPKKIYYIEEEEEDLETGIFFSRLFAYFTQYI